MKIPTLYTTWICAIANLNIHNKNRQQLNIKHII